MDSMDEIINLEGKSLSNREVLDLVNHKANFITYDKLANVNNIDDILEPHGACVILYFTAENYGHFCCLFRVEPGVLEFFDPYGLFVDKELDFNKDIYFRQEKNQDYPHLSYLLDYSPYALTYNNYKFQKKKEDVRTCGRHCACRINFRMMDLEKYKDFLTNPYLDFDNTVTLLTAMI